MRRLLIIISLLFISIVSYSQIIYTDILRVYDKFELGKYEIVGISNDTTLAGASPDSLVTQFALKRHLDALPFEGTTNTVYLISAMSDTTTITTPVNGDIAFVDSTLVAFRSSVKWNVFAGGGGSGSNSWDDLTDVPAGIYADTLPTNEWQNASQVSIADSGGDYTATNVEGALTEIADSIEQHRDDIMNSNNVEIRTEANRKVSLIGGVIRNNGDKSDEYNYFKLIDDASHEPVGIWNKDEVGSELVKAIETTTTAIRVYHNDDNYKVIEMMLQPDEAWLSTGLRVGSGSVGLNYTNFPVFRDGFASIQLSGGDARDESWSKDSGFIDSVVWNGAVNRLDVYHKECGGSVITSSISGTNRSDYFVRTEYVTSTWTAVYFFSVVDVASGYIYWNGSSFVCGSCYNMNLGTYINGELNINYTKPIRLYNQSAVNRGMHDVRLGSSSETLTKIKWVDSVTGETITTQDTEMKVFISAGNSSQLTAPANIVVNVNWKGTQAINPQNLEYLENSNFWISGKMLK